MRKTGKIWIYILCLMGSMPLYASPQTDSLSIYFQRGYAIVEPSFRNNRSTLQTSIAMLKKLEADSWRHLTEIHLKGNASPDGSASANLRLTQKRVDAMLKYLREEVQIPDSLITITTEGVDWEGLTVMVENDATCPAREELLDILYNTPEWIYNDQNQIVDGRRKQLMDLRGGVPYNYLAEKFFRDLRNTRITLHYQSNDVVGIQPDSNTRSTCESGSDSTTHEPLPEPSSPCDSLPDLSSEAHEEPTKASHSTATESAQSTSSEFAQPAQQAPQQRIALKTNLLYDAILMPDLEIEYRIDDRWSVAVDGSVAWWKKDAKHKYYQIATIVPEGRYWFRTQKPWHGHYVGLFAGGSWYDLENGARGYKGEFFMTGLSYGYMFPIGRALSLEAGIGLGFLHTTYEEYLPIDGHYVYQQTSRTNWIGPVRLKLALAWRLWNQH